MKRSCAAPLAIIVTALLLLAACGATPTTATTSGTSAKAKACAGLATINSTLTSLLSVNASTTVGDVRQAQTKITNALDTVDSHVPGPPGDLSRQIRSANAQLTDKVEGYPDSTPIGQTSESVQDIKAKATNAQAKVSLLTTALKCSA
jgi:hypothetical protein